MSDPIEAIVVRSRVHKMTLGELCLDCGCDTREPQCDPPMITVNIPATIEGSIVD